MDKNSERYTFVSFFSPCSIQTKNQHYGHVSGSLVHRPYFWEKLRKVIHYKRFVYTDEPSQGDTPNDKTRWKISIGGIFAMKLDGFCMQTTGEPSIEKLFNLWAQLGWITRILWGDIKRRNFTVSYPSSLVAFCIITSIIIIIVYYV